MSRYKYFYEFTTFNRNIFYFYDICKQFYGLKVVNFCIKIIINKEKNL